LVKISVNRYVTRRIATTRKEAEASTQKLRTKILKNLEEIFKAATKIARGEIKHQRTNHKMVRITLRQKRRWLLAAGHTAQIIKSITDNFDEQQINLQLNELKKLVEEATQPR